MNTVTVWRKLKLYHHLLYLGHGNTGLVPRSGEQRRAEAAESAAAGVAVVEVAAVEGLRYAANGVCNR